MKSYWSYKRLESVIGIVCVVGCFLMLALGVPFQITIGWLVITFASLIVVWRVSLRRYPQWRGFQWSLPWKLMIPTFIVAMALFFVGESYGWHIGDLRMRTIALVLIFVVQPLHDLWLTKKYELDKFTSVGELVAAHPEAKKKIYKPTID